MRRLKNLDVHEVSLVGKGANGKKYLIIKSQTGEAMPANTPAPVAEKLLAAFARIPKEKIEAIQLVAKSARARVRKADGEADEAAADAGDGALSSDAQDALRAAFRMLAPWSEELTPDVMGDFTDALGVAADEADEAPDAEAGDDVGKAEDAEDKDDAGVTKAEGEDDKAEQDAKASKSAEGEEEEDGVAKADVEQDDEQDGKAQKADDAPAEDEAGVTKADGMPDFADAAPDDIEQAMAAARQAYAEAMKQRGLKEAAAKSVDGPGIKEAEEDEVLAKSAVAKSLLSGLSAKERAALEPVLKSHESRFVALEAAHRELIEKSATLQRDVQRREFIAKAAKQYPALGRPEELGDAMMRLHQRDPEGLASWEAIMKAANAQAMAGGAEGMFGELGTSLGNSAGGSAQAELDAILDSRVEKSAGSRTREQIESDFYRTPVGKSLYARIQNESASSQRSN